MDFTLKNHDVSLVKILLVSNLKLLKKFVKNVIMDTILMKHLLVLLIRISLVVH